MKPGQPSFCWISRDEFVGCMLVKGATTRPSGRFRSYLQKKNRNLEKYVLVWGLKDGRVTSENLLTISSANSNKIDDATD